MSPSPTRMSPKDAAYVAWTEHRFYRYRGCAPDPDDPRLAVAGVAGESGEVVRVPLDAWLGPDLDGGEERRDRLARVEAAKEVCLNCPVMVQCDAYANLVPAQADGVRGGRTMRERGVPVASPKPQRPEPAPDVQVQTAQKMAVLRALAASGDVYRVAIESGVDVRKANWQRARLVTQLGLPRSASRMELLGAAVARGLLDAALVVADDGSVRAVPPATRKLLIEVDGQFLLWPSDPAEVRQAPSGRSGGGRAGGGAALGGRSGPRSPLRAKFQRVAGQEEFAVDPGPDDWAYVHDLFPSEPELQVAA